MAAFEAQSFVPKDSVCAVQQQLNGAFDMLSTDCSVFSLEYFPIPATYNVKDSDHSPLEFNVSVEGNYYLDLKISYFSMQLRLLKNGNPIPVTELVAPDSLCFHTMFDECSLYYNDVLISDSSGLYNHQAYLDRTLKSSPQEKTCDLQQEFLFDNETPDSFLSTDPGFKMRHELTQGSRLFTLSGKPALGLFEQDRLIFPGSTIRISLKRAAIEKVITTAEEIEDPSAFKLEIVRATFHAAKKILLKETLELHKKQVSLGKRFIYPYKDSLMRSFTIAKDLNSWESDHLIMGAYATLF